MEEDKTMLEIIYEWMKTCIGVEEWLYFNTVLMEDNNISLNTISDVKTVEYSNNASENDLIFEISFVEIYDAQQSSSNIKGIDGAREIIDKIEAEETLPILNDGYESVKFEIDEKIPTQVIDQELGLCAYKFQVRFKYSKY